MPIGGDTDINICHIQTKMLVNIVLSTFILSLTVHCRYAEEINVAITCANRLWFYADGQTIIQPNTPGGSELGIIKHVSVPSDTNVYGIKCVRSGSVGGIIAYMDNGKMTDGSWRCTNTKPDSGWLSQSYDDSEWQSAHVIHSNNRPTGYLSLISEIPRAVSWIWTNGWNGPDKTVYCRKAKPVSKHWGTWSTWTTCSGDCTTAVQTRTRQCSGDSCPGSNQQTKKCVPSVQNDDCARCKLNTANIGYLASCNDLTKYYQCQKDADGHYTVRLMSCADCTMWDQTQLTCVRDPSRDDCNDNTGSTGVKEYVTKFGSTCMRGDLHFGIVSDDSTKYMMYSHGVAIEMRCPLGTRFHLTDCGCTYVDTTHTVQTQLKPEMCITFETMTETSKWGFSESNLWISNHGKNWDSEHVQMSFSDCIEGRKCAYFNGQSYLSVDALANSFHTWKTFTISLWYKPSHLGTMGLLTNGLTSNGCSSLPTVSITTTNGQLNSHVALKDRAAQLKGQVIPNEWNHVSLIRDDDVISMYINGKMADQREIEGDLLPSQCSMMFGIGRNQAFFQGQMDKICLYKGALTEQQAIEEYVKGIPSDGYTGARFQHSGTGARMEIGATGAK